MRSRPDPGLRKVVDDLIQIIGRAQEPDGYLYTARTIDPGNPAPGAGKERWSNLRESHELYDVGHMYEAFGADYDLPNADAYAETCAAIGNAFWNQRLFQLHGDARYVDVLERIIYNGLLSGVSLSGDRFFYQNPLESAGKYERSSWFEMACCPANLARFLPTLPGYVYATTGRRTSGGSVPERSSGGSLLRLGQPRRGRDGRLAPAHRGRAQAHEAGRALRALGAD